MLEKSPRHRQKKANYQGTLATRRKILDVATQEFADLGLAGARVDLIAKRAGVAKRMIYYYFASKMELYQAVLRQVYESFRHDEEEMRLSGMPPVEAMRTLIEFTFDNHDIHPDFVRLVGVEDTHKAIHLANLPDIVELNASIITILDRILKRGQAAKVFRADLNALDLHLVMSSLSYFRVANRYTFGTIFDCDLSSKKMRATHRKLFADMIMQFLDRR